MHHHASGSVAEKLQQQRGDLLRLLLLNPVACPVNQVYAGHLAHARVRIASRAPGVWYLPQS